MPIEELGRGGMGIVYKCTDRKLLKEVAVKVIGWNLDDTEVIRFHKEAKALAKLQHPNILGIIHFGHSDNDSLFLVMELLTGRSLSSLIETGLVPPFDDALNIFIQICDGLHHAHKRDVLHRDIKPSNIFLERTARGDIKTTITDFGLAKLLTEDQRMTKTGVVMGSPPYMSPEQAAGGSVDERADIYSLGCLMFEVLTGQKPFEAPTVPALLMKQINEPAPRLYDIVPDRNYPEEMEQILAKCLAKNPDNRYREVSELRSDLKQLKENAAVTYGQIENASCSSQADSASQLNLFLQTGMQRQPQKTVAGKIAVIAVALMLIGGLSSFVLTALNSRIDKSKSEPVRKMSLSGAKNDTEFGAYLLKKSVPVYDRETPSWLQCKGEGGGAKLVDVVNTALTAGKKPGTFPYYIDATDSDLTEQQLESIKSLELVGLRLVNTSITDKALRDTIRKIPTLRSIELSGTKITDEGVKSLIALKELSGINLSNTAITDNSIPNLCNLPSIHFMCLMDCPNLTGSTFGALAKLPSVDLSVGGSNIKPENFKLLESVRLTYLDAARLNLTDKDLSIIAKLLTLKKLIITGNPRITSKGFLQLTALKNLTLIEVFDCPQVSQKARNQFALALPNVRFRHTDPENLD